MAKTFTPAVRLLEGLKTDVLWLLITIYAHRERSKFPTLATMSREAFVLELTLLESTSRDIVSRLTALDDKEAGQRGFPTALAAMNREGLTPRTAQMLKQGVKDYRAALNTLKVEHRNRYIAHVHELADVDPRLSRGAPVYEDCASRAVNLLDAMIDDTVGYELNIGSTDKVIDLREALSRP